MRVRTLAAMAAVVLGLSLPTAAMAAAITWSAPVAITDVNTTLGLPGTVLEAVSWGTTGSVVVTDTFGTITFQQGGDVTGPISGPITANTGGGGYIPSGNGVFSGSTGNTNFNTVLDSDGFTGDVLVTISNLTFGNTYTVQAFGVDDRVHPVIVLRSGQYQDTADGSGNNSAVVVYSTNQYVLGTFIADGATQSYYIHGVYDANTSFNAAIVRTVPEPTAITLFGFGGIGMSLLARRRRSR